MTEFTITGRNQYGEVVTETITSDMLNDPLVQELGYITREKYASIGIDLDAELNRMVKRKKTLMWYLYWSDKRICRALYRGITQVRQFFTGLRAREDETGE